MIPIPNNQKKLKTLIILIIWIFEICNKSVRKNLIKISKNQNWNFWIFHFLINYFLLLWRSVKDWQRKQDVKSHDNNSIFNIGQGQNKPHYIEIFQSPVYTDFSLNHMQNILGTFTIFQIWGKIDAKIFEICKIFWKQAKA